MHRRSFLKTSAGIVGGLSLVTFGCAEQETSSSSATQTPAASTGTNSLNSIGIQLYTLRNQMQADFTGTIERLAGIGYNELEFAGYYGNTAEDVKALLDRLGLQGTAAHHSLDDLNNNLSPILDIAETIGFKYIVLPYIGQEMQNDAGYRQLVEACNRIGAGCNERGIGFAYHNHDFEFAAMGDETAMDFILTNTDPELVDIELDLFWTAFAEKDPVDFFQRYPGRFKLCHVKDGMGREMRPVGTGNIDFARIFAERELAGLEHYYVEQDNATDQDDPFALVTTSYNNAAALRFG
ncbi:MAG: sugar phosphate isomerase/epimerase [Rhodothermales bacterium]